MKRTNSILKYFAVIALTLSCAAWAFAGGEKERMLERNPQIRALKTAGVIGEKANGLLGFVKKSPEDRALVNAENEDRKAVYFEIAQSQGSSAPVVATRRASQLVGQAVSGDWFQTAAHKWVQKK